VTNLKQERAFVNPATTVGERSLLGEAGQPDPTWRREALDAARVAVMQPGFWLRASLALAAALILGLALVQGLLALAEPLAILVLGLTLASALAPPVGLLGRWLPRAVAIVIVYLSLPLLLALILYFTIPPLVEQIQSVSTSIPDIVTTIQPFLSRLGNLSPSDLLNQVTSNLSQLTSSLVSVPLRIARGLVDLLAILFISIYAILEAPSMRRFALSLVPPERKQRLDDLLRDMVWEVGGYLRGASLDGLIIGLSTYVGLLLLGVDFPLVLSLFAGTMEIVPTVGPIIAAIPVLLVSLLQSPTKALFSLIFMVGLHQFEGNIVFPNVMGSQTSMSPLLALVALLGGYSVGGLLGALTAIPVVAVSRVFLLQVVAPAIRRATGAPEPEEEKEQEKNRLARWMARLKNGTSNGNEKEDHGKDR
jgi:predicted PurR-regulated permease PerM